MGRRGSSSSYDSHGFVVNGHKLSWHINGTKFACRLESGEEVEAGSFEGLKLLLRGKLSSVAKEEKSLKPLKLTVREWVAGDKYRWVDGVEVVRITARQGRYGITYYISYRKDGKIWKAKRTGGNSVFIHLSEKQREQYTDLERRKREIEDQLEKFEQDYKLERDHHVDAAFQAVQQGKAYKRPARYR